MNLTDRISLYEEIEKIRERPLIVYSTSTRVGAAGMMAGDAVREFIDQIECIKENQTVDVLINSSGGDALTAWKLMSVLRERFSRISVLDPYTAFSAATILLLEQMRL
jgi:ClpP class serine protease